MIPEQISRSVHGISTSSARLFIENIPKFLQFLMDNGLDILKYSTQINAPGNDIIHEGGIFSGKTIVFTGGKDTELLDLWTSLGGKLDNAITSNTYILITKDPSSNSNKIKTAKSKHIPIFTKEQAMEYIRQQINQSMNQQINQ